MRSIIDTLLKNLILVALLSRFGMILYMVFLEQEFVYQIALINLFGITIKAGTLLLPGMPMNVSFIPPLARPLWLNVFVYGIRPFPARSHASFGLFFITVFSLGKTCKEGGFRDLVFVPSAGQTRNL